MSVGESILADLEDKKIWKVFWNLKIPGNVKNTVWRTVKNVIPLKG